MLYGEVYAGHGNHLGATWTFAEGNCRAKGPTKSLCSTANVGSTMCSTGQPSSFTRDIHSLHRSQVSHIPYPTRSSKGHILLVFQGC